MQNYFDLFDFYVTVKVFSVFGSENENESDNLLIVNDYIFQSGTYGRISINAVSQCLKYEKKRKCITFKTLWIFFKNDFSLLIDYENKI